MRATETIIEGFGGLRIGDGRTGGLGIDSGTQI